MKYKTRPGLTYHVKNTHKDKDGNLISPVSSVAPVSGGLISDDSFEGLPLPGHHPMAAINHPSMSGGGATFTELSNSRYPDPVVNHGTLLFRKSQKNCMRLFKVRLIHLVNIKT